MDEENGYMEDNKNINDVLDERNREFASLQDFFGKDFKEEADYIAEKLEIDSEIVQKALDASEAFSEIAEGNPEYIVEEIDEDGLPVKMISGDKMYAFITEQTGIDEETLDKIFDCEVDYFEQFGLVE